VRIVVFGASGGTGRAFIAQAVEAGHDVTAVVRRAAVFAEGERLRVVEADVGVASQMDDVLRGQDVVVSAQGANGKGPLTVCTDVTRSILEAMGRSGTRRLVVVSAYGAADTHDRSPYSLMLWASVGNKMRDKESMEALVIASDVDWTIIRPPRLTDGPLRSHYRTGTTLKIGLTSKVSRADLADFMLTEAVSSAYSHQLPRISA
jgi:putative NADH-flavin reductase